VTGVHVLYHCVSSVKGMQERVTCKLFCLLSIFWKRQSEK